MFEPDCDGDGHVGGNVALPHLVVLEGRDLLLVVILHVQHPADKQAFLRPKFCYEAFFYHSVIH